MRPTVLDGNIFSAFRGNMITVSHGNMLTVSHGNMIAKGWRKIGGVHDARRGESRTQHRLRGPMVRWSTAAL